MPNMIQRVTSIRTTFASLALFLVGFGFAGPFAWAQPGRYVPTGVGPNAPQTSPMSQSSFGAPPSTSIRNSPAGLPLGGTALQQPVYIAERSGSDIPLGDPNGAVRTPLTDPDAPSVEFNDFDQQRAMQSTATPAGELFEAGRVIAVVGEERVLIGDLIDPRRVTAEMVANREFEMGLRKALVKSITTKCLAQHFLHLQTSGKPKKERDEIRTKVSARTAEVFKTKVLPEQLIRAKVDSELEFMQVLEESGTSLASMMRAFSEQMWADQAMRDGVQEKPAVQLHEMQEWYDSHSEQWNKPARVRFQIMSALFKKYPTRDAAYEAIAGMGNQVFLGGASFEKVAEAQSSGFNASKGGHFDWTSRGALKSKVIEDAAFTIELNGLSTILEDEDGLHIIQVLERDPDYRMTFPQAQSEIRKAVIKSKKEKQEKEYVEKVREMTPIWSRWPEDIPGAKDLSEIE
jgi:hypothetical protein